MQDPSSTLHALVIGVDHYPAVRADLSGCVNDALAMRGFLLDRAHFPAPNLRLLLAPVPGTTPTGVDLSTAPLADAAHILAALAALVGAARAGDHAVVFFAGHGVRITNRVTDERLYGFAPTDTARGQRGYDNLVLDRALNASLRRLTEAGVTVTVIADTCHSGGATREMAKTRSLEAVSLAQGAWDALVAEHPARTGLQAGADADGWVVLSACRDTELAKEIRRPEPHGLLTFALLEALRGVPGDAVAGLRWLDLLPSVRATMKQIAVEEGLRDQTPLLEGPPEKAVFSAAWTPFEPGFTVRRGPTEGTLAIDAGILHGLDEGAEVAVYPPATVRFAAAEADGVVPARARVEVALPETSTARLLDAGAVVADGSRARLVRPSPAKVAPLGVALRGVPEAIVAAIARAPDVAEQIALNPEPGAVGVEVRPWARGGWVIVPYTPGRDEVTPEDVIAYLPALDAPRVGGDVAKLGEALGRGLVRWAQYLQVLHRVGAAPTLAGTLEVALRVGADKDTATRRAPEVSGIHEVVDGEALWVEIAVRARPKQRLFAGMLLCSNDGNVTLLWPKEGGDPGLSEQVLYLGRDRLTPAYPTVREDQASSLYTFKVIAYTGPDRGEPVSLASLVLEESVQEVIDAMFARGRLRDPPAAASLGPAWRTWEVPVRVRRAG